MQKTTEEQAEALRSITSTCKKSEKALLKLKPGTVQYTMTAQSVKAYGIAITLIQQAQPKAAEESPARYTDKELEAALQAICSATGWVERVLPKFRPGTPQHTLAVRRIRAFQMAAGLIAKERQSLVGGL